MHVMSTSVVLTLLNVKGNQQCAGKGSNIQQDASIEGCPSVNMEWIL